MHSPEVRNWLLRWLLRGLNWRTERYRREFRLSTLLAVAILPCMGAAEVGLFSSNEVGAFVGFFVAAPALLLLTIPVTLLHVGEDQRDVHWRRERQRKTCPRCLRYTNLP